MLGQNRSLWSCWRWGGNHGETCRGVVPAPGHPCTQRPPMPGPPQRPQCQATSLSPATSTAAAQGPLPTWCPSVPLGLTAGWSCESVLNLDSPGAGRDKLAWGEPPDTAWHCPPWEESGSCDSPPHQPLPPSFQGELDDSRGDRRGERITAQNRSSVNNTDPLSTNRNCPPEKTVCVLTSPTSA